MIAVAALVVALSGTAYAAATITSADIVDGTIRGTDIRTGTVASADLKTGGVQSDDIGDGAVQGQDIADGVVPNLLWLRMHAPDEQWWHHDTDSATPSHGRPGGPPESHAA